MTRADVQCQRLRPSHLDTEILNAVTVFWSFTSKLPDIFALDFKQLSPTKSHTIVQILLKFFYRLHLHIVQRNSKAAEVENIPDNETGKRLHEQLREAPVI